MVPINIIYDVNYNSIRTTKFTAENEYGLEEIFFYCSNPDNKEIYCHINNSVLNLEKIVSDNPNYEKYRIVTSEPINFGSGTYELKMLYIGERDAGVSEGLKVNINTDNFNIISQLTMISLLSNEVRDKYEKILELTQMNIEIYKEMQGGEK